MCKYRIVKNTNGYYVIQKKSLFLWNTLGKYYFRLFIPKQYDCFEDAEEVVKELINKPKKDIVIKEYC